MLEILETIGRNLFSCPGTKIKVHSRQDSMTPNCKNTNSFEMKGKAQNSEGESITLMQGWPSLDGRQIIRSILYCFLEEWKVKTEGYYTLWFKREVKDKQQQAQSVSQGELLAKRGYKRCRWQIRRCGTFQSFGVEPSAS